jgi:hypothetical protein
VTTTAAREVWKTVLFRIRGMRVDRYRSPTEMRQVCMPLQEFGESHK